MTKKGSGAPYGEWRRHGWIVLPCFGGSLLSTFHAYSLGPMITPLENEFGWSRSGITGGLLVISLVALFIAPIVGMAADRYGPRRVAIPGVILYCTALGLLSRADNSPASWWALWLFLATVNMLVAPMIWTAAINMRFDRHRGLALALTLCGTSAGAAVIPLVTTILIEEEGWRNAYVWLAVIGLATVLPLVLLLFRDMKNVEAGAGVNETSRGSSRFGEVHHLATSARFLTLAGAVLVFTMGLCVFTTNGVPVLRGEGYSALAAATIVGGLGIGSLTGRLLGGLLLDRFEARKVAAIAVIFPAMSCALLLMTGGSTTMAAVAFLMIGLSSGVEYDASAYLAARHFGMRNFGALFGLITGAILLSNGIAPAGANLVYDLTGSYEPVIWVCAGLFLGSSALFYLLGSVDKFGSVIEL